VAWAAISFHQPNHISFKTVSLSSLWFYLIYCTWNLISSWLTFTFFCILVIHILSFSFHFFKSSSYSWRKAALVLYPFNALKTESQTQGYIQKWHCGPETPQSPTFCEVQFCTWAPLGNLQMKESVPSLQELTFLWVGQTTSNCKIMYILTEVQAHD
jgi:hypothetical protein